MKGKVGIVGMGRIGSRCAYTIATLGLAEELVLNDINISRVQSEVSDLTDCLSLYPHNLKINCGGNKELGDCDIIVITAGIQTNSQDRMSLLNANLKIVNAIVSDIMHTGFDGIFIVVSNPCDVLAWYVEKISGLGRNRVFATGTYLDTIRLKKELSLLTGQNTSLIQALVMGEHGASQTIPWSLVKISGILMEEFQSCNSNFDICKTAIEEKVQNGAWNAVAGKGVAEYGVSSCVASCVRAIFHDENKILPLGVGLKNEYGVNGVYAGVPAVIGAGGIKAVLEVLLTADELKAFEKSCHILKSNIDTIVV